MAQVLDGALFSQRGLVRPFILQLLWGGASPQSLAFFKRRGADPRISENLPDASGQVSSGSSLSGSLLTLTLPDGRSSECQEVAHGTSCELEGNTVLGEPSGWKQEPTLALVQLARKG